MNKVFDFLSALSANNNRPWFEKNKSQYLLALEQMEKLASEVHDRMAKFDVLATPNGKKSLHRIYRDVRFKADKTPYKQAFSARFKREGATRRGSYYLHIEPNNCFIAGGFWRPEPADLQLIREQLAYDGENFKKTVFTEKFKHLFGQINGEKLKTAPKGFDKNNPNIDLLVLKQFIIKHTFDLNPTDIKQSADAIAEGFQCMLPFFNEMSFYLTHDLNGESLL